MFEPQTYQDKRAALNEMLLQQMAGFVMRTADPQTRSHMQNMLEQYGRGQQLLRDSEATRVLGPVEKLEGSTYIDAAMMLEWLKANVGRTYFGSDEHTTAPQGSIGTAGFDQKFDAWLASLPSYDTSVSKDMFSGFYRDDMTATGGKPLPMLVIRDGDEITVILLYKYVSVMTLNLSKVPADYRWENPNHYALRGEMYTYRGNMRAIDFEVQFAAALADQGLHAIHEPKLATATAGLAQTEEHVVDSEETPTVVEDTDSPPLDEVTQQAEEAHVGEIAAEDIGVLADVLQDSSQAVSSARGESAVFINIDELGYVPETFPPGDGSIYAAGGERAQVSIYLDTADSNPCATVELVSDAATTPAE